VSTEIGEIVNLHQPFLAVENASMLRVIVGDLDRPGVLLQRLPDVFQGILQSLRAEGVEEEIDGSIRQVRRRCISAADLNRGLFPAHLPGIFAGSLAQGFEQFDAHALPHRFLRSDAEHAPHAGADVVENVIRARIENFENLPDIAVPDRPVAEIVLISGLIREKALPRLGGIGYVYVYGPGLGLDAQGGLVVAGPDANQAGQGSPDRSLYV